jgi:hypothetical protein
VRPGLRFLIIEWGVSIMTKVANIQYPFVTWVIDGVADFIGRQSRRLASSRELDALSAAEVSSIARDLKLSKSSLRELAAQEREPHLLVRMLASLNKTMPPSGDVLTRDMQAVCSLCRSKGRCNRELSTGTAPANYTKFCPNAFNLDLLPWKEKPFASGDRQLLPAHPL